MSDPQTQEPAPAPEIPAPAPEPPAPAPAPPPPAPATAEDDETYCRVCYGEDNESDNRLFAPCSCTGGAQLIHLRCLEEWIEKRPSRNETEVCGVFFFHPLLQMSFILCFSCSEQLTFDLPSLPALCVYSTVFSGSQTVARFASSRTASLFGTHSAAGRQLVSAPTLLPPAAKFG